MPRDVEVDILARDKTGRGVRSATEKFRRLKRETDDSSKSLDGWTKRAERLGKATLGMVRSVGKVVATVAAASSAIGPATSGIIAATKATVAFGKASARTFTTLAPLVAFLPSLAGGAGLLVGTLKLAGPGLLKALKPISDFFSLGKKKGGVIQGVGGITAELQRLIAVGVEPLAKQFAKVNLPTIATGMLRITAATNSVVRAVGSWLNSTDGQRLIRDITLSTAAAMERLAPHVTAAAIALGRLALQAGDRAITGLADLIGRILDKFTRWAEGKSVEDINRALGKLRDTTSQARAKLADLQTGLQWLVDHQAQIKTASNVLAGIALVFGAATGNWVAAIVAGLSLVVNNLGSFKRAVGDADSGLRGFVARLAGDQHWRRFFTDGVEAFQRFVKGFVQHTGLLGQKWDELMGRLKVAWQQWEPIIHLWWEATKPVFEALGTVVGAAVVHAVTFFGNLASVLIAVGVAAKAMVLTVLDVLGWIIKGAAAAFSWVPGLGPKLQAGVVAFEQFRDKVNAALGGIQDQTVVINVVAKTSTTNVNGKRVGVGEGGTLPRTGAFGDGPAWRPAQVAQQFAAMFAASGGGLVLAGAGGGGSRTGGPTPVEVMNNLSLTIDGEPIRHLARREAETVMSRQAWRAKVGRR